MIERDTIAAQVTPIGRGAVGIIRVSGERSKQVVQQITGRTPKPRYAEYCRFLEADGSVLDVGLVLFFPAPHSFTGEDVVEFQGHGGPVVLDRLLQRILQMHVRVARPGEFSERAFQNGKLDLTQAEAIADLINSTSEQAARSAVRSLQGDFSAHIQQLQTALTELRTSVEATLDFPEEDLDLSTEDDLNNGLSMLLAQLQEISQLAQCGVVLQEGAVLVLAGYPNAGKSTLLNKLCGDDRAIVTDIPGTTRDLMREYVLLDGVPCQFIDTAGLRESDDIVEQEGIRRTWSAIQKADCVLFIIDASQATDFHRELEPLLTDIPEQTPLLVVCNKIDLLNGEPRIEKQDVQLPVVRPGLEPGANDRSGEQAGYDKIYLSAKTGQGLDLLKEYLLAKFGFSQTMAENGFIARRRHLDALRRATESLTRAAKQVKQHQAGELFAEDLRQTQQVLGEITGEFTSDDLLGEIFSHFCIGK